MKYYKKENVEREIVEEYKITKLKCDCCGKMIEEGMVYAEICEIPKSLRDDIVWKDICMDSYLDYFATWADTWRSGNYYKVECEFKEFKPHNVPWIDELIDKEDVEEIDAETN